MTFYQGLATVLLKVWAATMLVAGLRWVIDFGMSWNSQPLPVDPQTSRYLLGGVASGATYLVIAIAMWFCALPVGRWLGGAIPAAEPAISISATQIVSAGSFLIGLFILAEYAPRVMTDAVIVFVQAAQQTDAERLYGPRAVFFPGHREVAMNWAIVAAALLIMFRARDVGRLFVWLRGAGLRGPEEETAPPKPSN